RIDFRVANQIGNERQRDESEESTDGAVRGRLTAGTLVAGRGQPISEAQALLLREEARTFQRSRTPLDQFRHGAALFLVLALLAALVVLYVVRFQPSLAQSLQKTAGVCALVLLTIALGLALSRPPWYAVLIPLTVTALILTISYNPQFALLMTLSLTLAMVVMLSGRLGDFLIAMGGQTTAILALQNVRTRTRLVEIGFLAGGSYVAMTVATGLHTGQTWALIGFDAGRGLIWGALAGFLVSGL